MNHVRNETQGTNMNQDFLDTHTETMNQIVCETQYYGMNRTPIEPHQKNMNHFKHRL